MVRQNPIRRLLRLIWGNWQTNELWQRIVKGSVACTVALILAFHPAIIALYGTSTFLIVQTTVFASPGQRLGRMIESLLMAIFGALLGLGWSLFGLYLSSLVMEDNPPAAYSIRALFLIGSVLFHGFVRSSSPRLFVFVLLSLIASVQIFLGSYDIVTKKVFTTVMYPILTGAGILLAVNLSLFPELSSSYLGSSTIDTLSQTVDTLNRATQWFITPGGDAAEIAQRTFSKTDSRGTRTKAPLKQEKASRKGLIGKFFDDFPNPFQTAKRQVLNSQIPLHLTTLASLTDRKSKLRAQMAHCKGAQDEVNFEISISPLPPALLKPISTRCMTSLIQNTITLIGACENKFVILGNYDRAVAPDQHDQGRTKGRQNEGEQTQEGHPSTSEAPDGSAAPRASGSIWQHIPGMAKDDNRADKDDYLKRVENVKPLREIEASSATLLELILTKLRDPVQEFDRSLQEAVVLLTSCVAYCYDVSTLPSGTPTPKGISLEEIDLRIDAFNDALVLFDGHSSEELRQAAIDESGHNIDLMPRMEMFLVSSFLLAYHQAATHILDMLRHARDLVEMRRRRHDRSRVWLPRRGSIRQWFVMAGESDAVVLPNEAKKSVRRGDNSKGTTVDDEVEALDHEPLVRQSDEEALPGIVRRDKRPSKRRKQARRSFKATEPKPETKNSSWLAKIRNMAADAIEWTQDSEDLAYALKLAIAVVLVSWPAFVTSWNGWYMNIRGFWAPMQLVLVFEVVIGSSFLVFFVRLFGVIFGCAWGYLAYVIGGGSRAAMIAVLFFGVVPSVYIQLATKYVKAGMIAIISMTVVALSTVNASGTAVENFYTRLSAFVVGGSVAMLVEVVIYPVRARDRLVESLSASVRQIQNMQGSLAVGIDGPERPNFRAESLNTRFNHARSKAQASLAAAETFLPFCLTEPRIKGSFKPLAPIYKEIIYVLHQIIDRMDSALQLRKTYGSSVLEDLHPQVYAYRRNVAASTALMLFSVNEALTTWLPLPQFIPSTRLAQIRLINRVREVLDSRNSRHPSTAGVPHELVDSGEVDEYTAEVITQRKFLSWNASTAGQMEIIEYLEELIELAKLLVGVNAFRSGMLEKPNYKQYAQQLEVTVSNSLDMDRTGTAPAAGETSSATDEGQGQEDGLRRTQTVAKRVERFKERLTKTISGTTALEDESEEEDIPRSLQRVRTRVQQENEAVRRRGYSDARGPV